METNEEIEETTESSQLDMENTDQNILLADHIEKEISCMPPFRCFIYRVPTKLRLISEHTFEPCIVSIGPYHHGKRNLEDTEKYKACYLHSLISRTSQDASHTCLRDLVKVVRDMELAARECYAEQIELSSDEFVRMMILDGCFILELFKKYQEKSNTGPEDWLFNTWIVHTLRRDLSLLENQVPFIVLECLFSLCKSPTETCSLYDLVLKFFEPILSPVVISPISYCIQGNHLLDILHHFLLPPYSGVMDIEASSVSEFTGSVTDFHSSQEMNFGYQSNWKYTSCATDLQNAGVKFERKETTKGLLDITFSRDGILEMPPLYLGEEAWTILLPNLIALEQCRRDYPDRITSYFILLNKLMNSHNDVKLLCDEGIIDCYSGNAGKAACLIADICEVVDVDNFHYDVLCDRVNAYRGSNWSKWRSNFHGFWHEWRGSLLHECLRTPVVAVFIFFTVILRVLVLTQINLHTDTRD